MLFFTNHKVYTDSNEIYDLFFYPINRPQSYRAKTANINTDILFEMKYS